MCITKQIDMTMDIKLKIQITVLLGVSGILPLAKDTKTRSLADFEEDSVCGKLTSNV